MLTSGDVVRLDFGTPIGSEAGLMRPAIIVTGQRVLSQGARVVHVVPLTTTVREWTSEVSVPPDVVAGVQRESAAQCQHIRAVSTARVVERIGNVGPVLLRQIRETLAVLLDL
jgi:mRNA interferase MazF